MFAVISCCRIAPNADVVWSHVAQVASGDARYDQGVSAMYAASVGGVLLIAGGANFPDTPAADGGKKAFYDYIYMYDGDWRCIGRLPGPAAYGVSYSCGSGAVFAGGSNKEGAVRSVYMVEIEAGMAKVSELALLPCAIEQAAGTSIDGRLYLFGGIADGTPSASLFLLDTNIDGAEWQTLAPAPEPFVQPVAAASGGRLYVWGGFDPSTKSVGGHGYCYDPQHNEWSKVAGHPDGGTFTGSCALTLTDGRILFVGGVDREIFSDALQLSADKIREYQKQPVEAYRFQRALHIFDPVSGEWSCAGESECAARAGASLMALDGAIYLLGGELKPGIRTSENFRTTMIN